MNQLHRVRERGLGCLWGFVRLVRGLGSVVLVVRREILKDLEGHRDLLVFPLLS